MAIKKRLRVDASASSASMTDLIFLLLLFMFLVTTMVNPNALQLNLPKSSNEMQEKPFASVSIDKDKQYYFNLKPVAVDELEAALQAFTAGTEQPTISLHCDESVPIGEVVKVMYNIAKRNRYRLILATNPE